MGCLLGCPIVRTSQRTRKNKRKVAVLLIGLDNAGKSTTAKGLAGGDTSGIVPTIGFTSVQLELEDCLVTVYDLGGGQQIRGIWPRYYGDVHGVVFVVDSADIQRIVECRVELENVLMSDKIARKPILILANKQDVPDALDEVDIVEALDLERIVNRQKCPTSIQVCSALPKKRNSKAIDPCIKSGFRWLIRMILRNYEELNHRVLEDKEVERIRFKQEYEKWKKRQDGSSGDHESSGEPVRRNHNSNNFIISEISNNLSSEIPDTIVERNHRDLTISATHIIELGTERQTNVESSRNHENGFVEGLQLPPSVPSNVILQQLSQNKTTKKANRFTLGSNNRVSPLVSNNLEVPAVTLDPVTTVSPPRSSPAGSQHKSEPSSPQDPEHRVIASRLFRSNRPYSAYSEGRAWDLDTPFD